jgi:lipoprotein-releasing system ATP-binding protein
MTIVLKTVGLVRRVQGATVATLVDHADIAVEQGEFVAITGPSGSGKSSLLYLLGLLDAPTEGEIFVMGEPTSGLSESEKAALRLRKIGFVFQFHFLLPEFSALENVMIPMRTLGRLSLREMRERGTALLASLGLDADIIRKRPNQLSGGQRQRVAIARALANDPDLIMADEPTGALDTSSSEQVFGILRDLANQGRTIAMVTHDVGLASRADRRINIVDGRVESITRNRRTGPIAASIEATQQAAPWLMTMLGGHAAPNREK